MTDDLGTRLSRDLHRLAARVDPVPPPPPLELLERRAATPGRRVSPFLVVGVAAALIAVVGAGLSRSASGPAVSRVASRVGSRVDAAASPAQVGGAAVAPPPMPFAVATDGRLVDEDGRVLGTDAPTSTPHWSSDGLWVMYQASPSLDVHVVAASGSSDTVVWAAPVVAAVWSPAGPDRLAILPRTGGVAVVTPTGSVTWVVPSGTPVVSVAWKDSAVSWSTPDGLVHVLGSPAVAAVPGASLVIDGWVGSDLLAWASSEGADEDDGLPLEVIGPTGRVATLATTLVAPAWVVPGPAGTPAAGQVLIVAGAGAIPWEGKQVLRCTLASGACMPVAPAWAGVTLDPAWSPDGTEIAFVAAPSGGFASVAAWFPSRGLWVLPAHRPAHAVAGAPTGATAPSWSPDGAWIRVSTGDAVVAVDPATGSAVTLASGLSGGGGGAGPDGYGKGPWTSLAAFAP